jgi:hypothetical protein
MVAILHADIEAEFIGYMVSALQERPEAYAANVRVSNRVPNESSTQPWPASGRLVVVRYDGGPRTPDVRATARIGVRVWAEDEATTSDLANLVSALVGAWRSPVVRVSNPTLPTSVTEESSRPAQYFTAELMIRGRQLPAA